MLLQLEFEVTSIIRPGALKAAAVKKTLSLEIGD
jgi:hypothetical protein